MLNVKKVQADLLAIQIEKDRKDLALLQKRIQATFPSSTHLGSIGRNEVPNERAKPGGVMAVNDDANHYPLPPGLKAGTLFRLLEFDHGYWSFGRWISGAGPLTREGLLATLNRFASHPHNG